MLSQEETMFTFHLAPDSRVYGVLEESHRETPFFPGGYYQGFGTKQGMIRSCIEPLQIGGVFIKEQCQRITLEEARAHHPELVAHVESRLRGGAFYTCLQAKDIEPGMNILISQSFCEVLAVFPDESMLVRHTGGLDLFNATRSVVREVTGQEAQVQA